MKYTVQLKQYTFEGREAEQKLRGHLKGVEVTRVFGNGRYANVDISEQQLDELRHSEASSLLFQKDVLGRPFDD